MNKSKMKKYEYVVYEKYAFTVAGSSREDVENAMRKLSNRWDKGDVEEIGKEEVEADDPSEITDFEGDMDTFDEVCFVVDGNKMYKKDYFGDDVPGLGTCQEVEFYDHNGQPLKDEK